MQKIEIELPEANVKFEQASPILWGRNEHGLRGVIHLRPVVEERSPEEIAFREGFDKGEYLALIDDISGVDNAWELSETKKGIGKLT